MNNKIFATCALLCAASAHAQVTISDPPADHNFGRIPLRANYAAQYFSLTNSGATSVTLGQASIDGQIATCAALGCPTPAAMDFVIDAGSDGCSGKTLQAGQSCSTLIGFVPSTPGSRVANFVVPIVGASSLTRALAGVGVANPIDCVLDWAERSYPQLLSAPTATFAYPPFYARCYQGGALCIGADVLATLAPASVYLYQGGVMNRYEYLSKLAATAYCE
ncbi:MAG: hypothetical protein WC091_11695 [Sulfuricellaceae bacterium]